MKKYFKKSVIVLLTITLFLSLSACSKAEVKEKVKEGGEVVEDLKDEVKDAVQDTKDAEKGTGSVTIYTAFPESEVPFYINAFEEETGIKCHVVRLSAGEILAKLQVEKNNPQASVWFGGPSDTFIAANREDLLEPYQSAELSNVPEEQWDKEKVWNPIYVGAMSFACNKEWFADKGLEYPKSWDDLLKPEFEDQISMAHPGASGTAYTILATIIQKGGEDAGFEYMKKLNANVRQYTKSGAAPAKEVGLGEAAIGITFAHDALKPAAEGYPIELSFPDDGTGYEVGAVALIKNGPEAEVENAKRFIDWSISEAGQSYYAVSQSFRVPANEKVPAPEGSVDINKLKLIDYDAEWAGEHKKELVEKFTKIVAAGDELK